MKLCSFKKKTSFKSRLIKEIKRKKRRAQKSKRRKDGRKEEKREGEEEEERGLGRKKKEKKTGRKTVVNLPFFVVFKFSESIRLSCGISCEAPLAVRSSFLLITESGCV